MRSQIIYSLFAAIAAVVTCAPCQAQSAAVTNTALENGISRTSMRPGVRYTTGSYVVTPAGFEKKLVKGDPNLGHWNWSPVIGYNQGSVKTSRQAVSVAPPLPERKSVYIKPNHIPLPFVDHSIKVKADVIKPVVSKTVPVDSHISRRSETDTHLVLSYGGNYRGADGIRAAAQVHGVLTHQSVGAILSQSMQY